MPVINRLSDPTLSLVPPFIDFRALYLQSPALTTLCSCFNRMIFGQQDVFGLFDHMADSTFREQLQRQNHRLASARGTFVKRKLETCGHNNFYFN